MVKKKPETLTLRDYYAGFASRFLALVIDILILAVVLAISAILWIIVIETMRYLMAIITKQQASFETISLALVVIVTAVTFAVYFIFFWTTTGTTIGGLVVGTRVVNTQGRNPTLLQAIVRFLTEFGIPFFFIFGSLWIPFSRRRRALYDRIAGTYVIYAWDAKPDEIFLKQTTDNMANQ